MSSKILVGDALERLQELPDESVQCVVTSPPYWGLRDYGVDGAYGLEPTLDEYIERMVEVFSEVRRVLRKDGTLWLNLGDAYAGSGKGLNGDGSHSVGGKQDTNIGALTAPRPGSTGLKPKDLIGLPWRVAFALQADGWWLRSDIIWSKPNPMPESVRDRPTRAHEYVFLLTKSARYYYDADAIRTPPVESSIKRWSQNIDAQAGSCRAHGGTKANGPMKAAGGPRRARKTDKQRGHGRRHAGFNARGDAMSKAEQQAEGANKRSVWTIATKGFPGAHFATFPPALVEPCILAGSRGGDTILDPFSGSGTTGLVALRLGRKFIGIELNPEYATMAERRIREDAPLVNEVEVIA